MFINILLELTTNYSITGVEKNIDDAKRHYYSGNRHDAARDILLTEARIEKLTWDTPTCVRTKRKYTKKNADYWEKEIYWKRERGHRHWIKHEHVQQISQFTSPCC